MTTVDRIRKICKERRIAISTLEQECGFSNGYFNSLSKGFMPDDRLRRVAIYLKVTTHFLMYGQELSQLEDYDMRVIYYVKKNITDVKFALFVETLKRFYQLEKPEDNHLIEMEEEHANTMSRMQKYHQQ